MTKDSLAKKLDVVIIKHSALQGDFNDMRHMVLGKTVILWEFECALLKLGVLVKTSELKNLHIIDSCCCCFLNLVLNGNDKVISNW